MHAVEKFWSVGASMTLDPITLVILLYRNKCFQPRPYPTVHFFHFHAVLAKIGQPPPPRRGWRVLLWEILDPPLYRSTK